MIVQGDVFLIRAEGIPPKAKRIAKSKRGYILAMGEATGHAHVIEDDIKLYELDGILYLRTTKAVAVRHEEHLPVVLSEGTWRVGIVRQYDPFKEEARLVKD